MIPILVYLNDCFRTAETLMPRLRFQIVQAARRGTLCVCLAYGVAAGQSYDELFTHARQLLKEQRYTEAVVEGRKTILADKNRWEGYYVTAAAYAGANNCEAALPYFESAVEHGAPERIKTAIADAVRNCELQMKSSPAPPAAPSPAVVTNPVVAPRILGSAPELPSDVLPFKVFHLGSHKCGSDECDSGDLRVSPEGIEFLGSVHHFTWKRADIAEVKISVWTWTLIKLKGSSENYRFAVDGVNVSPQCKSYFSDHRNCSRFLTHLVEQKLNAAK
jgi:hypothetical protein